MKRVCWLLVFLLGSINLAVAQEVYQAHTHVRLVSEQNSVVRGGTFWVGLDLILDDGWHVYWQNPGDSGLSPKIKWHLSSGINAGDIHWPYPQRLNVGPLTSFGYEHEVLLLVPITLDKSFQPSKDVNIYASVKWLACQDTCVPGKAELNFLQPIVTSISDIKFNSFKTLFDQTRQDLPQLIPCITSHAALDGNQWRLDIQTPLKRQGDIIFYPFRDDVVEHAAPQETRNVPYGYQLIMTKSHLYHVDLKALEGIAVNPSGWDGKGKTKAIVIQAPLKVVPVRIPFFIACLFALIGGLILNLMPCVLPVLSIKVLYLIDRHPDSKIAFRHSLVYALGVLASVWALALLLFILKSAGQFAGWGFQFQSSVFVVIVALILFFLALNLFGVFEFSAPSINGLPTRQAGYKASFISGVITTIVASPCTAPFMGTALAVAISQPNIIGFGIFTFLGLGLALPFVLLSAFPFLLSFAPRPGAWMIYLKRALGFVLLVCVIWFLGVVGTQTGLVDFSKFYKSSDELHWQRFSSTAVNQARHSGHGVFIDFTAGWCINCQVNDRLVLQNSDVVRAFKDKGIIAFKADWTKYDPSITQALASFDRDSIPVYIYYPPGADAPIILPQIITPGMILERVNNHA
ncbi:MAG: thioredoxin family protein [Candidatus Omnitrophica bacterium]|nr:thioredoxin family protein [Candidatus Omnitrophota bacterium]